MAYLRILSIQDISCVGQCSLTVALPILSVCGLETCILPSAVLSAHTAPGFSGYTFRDLSEDMPKIQAHWQEKGIFFDAFYTGYLGNAKQIAYVQNIFETMGRPGARRIVDPAMADGGKLYPGFDADFVAQMKSLCQSADIILPNLTEAALLAGLPYRGEYDASYLDALLQALQQQGMQNVVLTGVRFSENQMGVVVAADGKKEIYAHRHMVQDSHGTGDVYAATFVGALLKGKSIYDAAKIAADFTLLCMEKTAGDESHWYGVKFELALPDLIQKLQA